MGMRSDFKDIKIYSMIFCLFYQPKRSGLPLKNEALMHDLQDRRKWVRHCSDVDKQVCTRKVNEKKYAKRKYSLVQWFCLKNIS